MSNSLKAANAIKSGTSLRGVKYSGIRNEAYSSMTILPGSLPQTEHRSLPRTTPATKRVRVSSMYTAGYTLSTYHTATLIRHENVAGANGIYPE